MMMAYLVLGCSLLLLLSSAAGFDVSFSSSTYYSQVATLEDPVGKVIVESELVYNDSEVKEFTTKDYSLFRSDGNYFAVDKKGVITLKTPLRYRRLYIFQLSMLYTVTLLDNTTTSGFLTADVRVQAIGPVHFDNTTYIVYVPTSAQVYEVVYNFLKHVVYNESAFQSVYIEFDYVYSSYFSIDATTGDLYVRRALYPGRFSVRVEIEYDVTLKNGTVFSDDEYVYATVYAIGCKGEEEIKAFWPETYPCSAYSLPCVDVDNSNYFTGGYATRVCSATGEWSPPDYTGCSVKKGSKSFALVWMTFSTSSGSYVLSRLDNIKADIEDLFPSNSVSNISPVSGFRSNVQYGFMMGFVMTVDSSKLSESDIRSAQLRLRVAYRFGYLYLRSSISIQGRGIRVFRETGTSQCDVQPEFNDTKYVPVCSGNKCNCTDITIKNNGSCDNVIIKSKDEEDPTYTPTNTTGPSYLSLNASDYYGKISAFSPTGTYILTVGYNVTGNVANVTNYHYDISGYYSDYFRIDRVTGDLTVYGDLFSRTYSFDVSFFYTVNFTNGTIGHNYTESDVYITAFAGVGFNATSHYITLDTDYVLNVTVLARMSDFLSKDDNFVVDTLNFYYITDSRFSLDPSTGDIKIVRKLDPLRTHYVRVYLRFNGTINSTQAYYTSVTSMLVQIYTKGCFEVENGKMVWPATHVCTTVAHPCQGVDQAFNPDGNVTRYCSSTGDWLDADYSQCSLKPGTNPFVHLYLTFYTGSSSHILNNLQNIIRSAGSLLSRLSVKSLTPYAIKDSVIRYGMVVVLRGEVKANDTILTSINSTIYRTTTFARIRLQLTGNGIVGFKASNKCEYPKHPSNALNASTFTAVCMTSGSSCNCPVIKPTVGLCETKPTTTPTPTVPTTPPPALGLIVSVNNVSNTSVELMWSDDTPGITSYKVQYSAVIPYTTVNNESSSYIDSKEITTTNTSYMFTLLTPSTDYTFTVTSYIGNDISSTKSTTQNTMKGREENPAFVQLRFTSEQDCTRWQKGSELTMKTVTAIASQISTYCKCQYSSEYIKLWDIKCHRKSDGTSDVIMIFQLMPTNLYKGTFLMESMSTWVTDPGVPTIIVDGEVMKINQACQVQIDHPYGTDCVVSPVSTGLMVPTPVPVSGNNDDDDNNNNTAGAAVGGVIAGLVIICFTIIVLVVVVMLLRKREKRQSSKPEIPSSSYSADTMKVQLAGDF